MADESNPPELRPLGVDAFPPGSTRDSFMIEEFHRSQRETRRNQPCPVELLVGSWFFDETWRADQRAGVEEVLDTGLPDPSDPTEPIEPEDELREEVSIFLVVTGIRVAWHELPEADWYADYYQHPEYEVEGWLLNPPGNPEARVWVLCRLKTTDDERLDECTVYLLEPGEERGTVPTPGVP